MRTNFFAGLALVLPTWVKRLIIVGLDCALCALSVWFAFFLRLGEFVSLTSVIEFQPITAVFTATVLVFPLFYIAGIYQIIIRYFDRYGLMLITRTIIIYGVIFAGIFLVLGVDGVPRTIGLIQPLLLLLLVIASRVGLRFLLVSRRIVVNWESRTNNVLIYGAGVTGRHLAANMSNEADYKLVGFLDDDEGLYGRMVGRVRVYKPLDVSKLKEKLQVRHVILAMPNLVRNQRNKILERLLREKISVRTLPCFGDLMQGRVNLSDIRDLDLDELLAREEVLPDRTLLHKGIQDKIILVTGAGGSIGSELCRQIVAMKAGTLILVEQSEYALYSIHQELISTLSGSTCSLVPLLASVANKERIDTIISTYSPDTIFHAAAYKHVPLVEQNPVEGINNNVFGTLTIARSAVAFGVPNFVLISTDKAVRPTNIMGASKRLAEMVLQALANEQNSLDADKTTIFSMVRFGNVLGSSGSVVPKFRKQILEGGPLTVTHDQVTRYFMSISEAAQLVIQASALAEGGEVFVLDMHEPVRIIDLARRMIHLSGLTIRDAGNPDGDIEIKIVGLRPGEKLFEELLIGNNPEPTSHPRIMKSHEDYFLIDELDQSLRVLRGVLASNDVQKLRALLESLNIGYQPDSILSDEN